MWRFLLAISSELYAMYPTIVCKQCSSWMSWLVVEKRIQFNAHDKSTHSALTQKLSRFRMTSSQWCLIVSRTHSPRSSLYCYLECWAPAHAHAELMTFGGNFIGMCVMLVKHCARISEYNLHPVSLNLFSSSNANLRPHDISSYSKSHFINFT